jgi:hypothetical protein
VVGPPGLEPGTSSLSGIDSRAPCYPAFPQAVRLRRCRRDGVNAIPLLCWPGPTGRCHSCVERGLPILAKAARLVVILQLREEVVSLVWEVGGKGSRKAGEVARPWVAEELGDFGVWLASVPVRN